MAGLEGAPSAVESHLHRGESQIGHKILTTLRIAVLHLDRGRQIKRVTSDNAGKRNQRRKHKGTEASQAFSGIQYFFKWLA